MESGSGGQGNEGSMADIVLFMSALEMAEVDRLGRGREDGTAEVVPSKSIFRF